MDVLQTLWQSTGVNSLTLGMLVMTLVGLLLIYLAIVHKFEPLLLLPIGFGAVLTNIPLAGLNEAGGLLYYLYQAGISTGVFPLLIFLGVGALTDFGALLANPKVMLLGAAAQFGIFATLIGAVALNFVPGLDFTLQQAAAIAIIGGADGPTAIYLASQLAPELLGAIAVAAYSYMALVPIIQPSDLMRIILPHRPSVRSRMTQLKPCFQNVAKILFPLLVLFR